MNDLLRQEDFLNQILCELSNEFPEKTDIQLKLESLRNDLLQDGNIRFYMCTDLAKLHATHSRPIDAIWLEHFPSGLKHNENQVFVSNKPYQARFTWNLKKGLTQPQPKMYSPSPKQNTIVRLGSTESAYLRLVSSTDIDNYKHENYAGLLVLIEYFTQTEVNTNSEFVISIFGVFV
jgi:Zn-dependent M16 (insulinase) family peptidase